MKGEVYGKRELSPLVGMTKGGVDGLKRGANATITLFAFVAPKEPIALNISLKGFTAAWTDASGS